MPALIVLTGSVWRYESLLYVRASGGRVGRRDYGGGGARADLMIGWVHRLCIYVEGGGVSWLGERGVGARKGGLSIFNKGVESSSTLLTGYLGGYSSRGG